MPLVASLCRHPLGAPSSAQEGNIVNPAAPYCTECELRRRDQAAYHAFQRYPRMQSPKEILESPRERAEARGPYRRAHADLTNYLEQQQQASAPAAPAATRRVSFSSHVAIHTRRSLDQSDLPPTAATEEDVRYAEHTPEDEYRNRRNLRQFQRRALGQYQPGRWTLDDGTSSFWNTSDPWEGMPPPGPPPPQKPLPPLPAQFAATTAAASAGPFTAPSSTPAPPTQTAATAEPSNAPSAPPPVPAKDGASDEDEEDESEGESEDDEDEEEEREEDEDEEDLPEHLRIDPDLAHLTYEEMQERIAFLRGRLEELRKDPNSPSQ